MDIFCASLRLTPPWEKERLLLVRANEALRLCSGGGCEEVPAHRGVAWVERLSSRDRADVRRFVAREGLCPFNLSDVSDESLLRLLRDKVQGRELAVIREGESGAGGDGRAAELGRLVREIEKAARQGLSYGGRRYRLVADIELDGIPGRDNYEVVPQKDAVAVLGALAEQAGRNGGLAKLLAEAAGLLTKDWRPPMYPEGLVLLRRIFARAATAATDGPALTPSQLKKLTQKDWIEIELVDQDGEPVSMPYKLELTDDSTRKGEFDEDGFLGVYEIESGNCKLTIGETGLPDSGADVPAPSLGDTNDGSAEAGQSETVSPAGPTTQEPAAELDAIKPEVQAFSVKVVDEAGKPIAKAPMVFRWNGGEATVPTGSDGTATCPAPDQSVTISFETADALAKLMTPIWTECRGLARKDWVPADDSTTIVTLLGGSVVKAIADPSTTATTRPKETLEPFSGVRVAPDKPITLSVQPLVIMVRMLGELFDIDKCFLLPKALDNVQELVKLHREYALTNLLIVGHTDTSASESYNLDLSLERTSAMMAYLFNDAKSWYAWYGEDKKQSKRWGGIEDNHMIETLLDGSSDDITVLGYQQWHNANGDALKAKAPDGGAYYETLKEDGTIGEHTRMQLIYDYMNREDTTAPAATPVQVHGCGEFFPLDPTGEEIDETTPDGQHIQRDRRVEVFLFPSEIGVLPPVPGEKATKDEGSYPEWRRRSVEATTFVPAGNYFHLRLRLHDSFLRTMPGAIYRYRVDGQAAWSRLVKTDTQGWADIQTFSAAPQQTVLIEWDPINKDQTVFRYQRIANLLCDPAGSDASARDCLHNLGYDQETFDEAVAAFQADYGISETGYGSATKEELHKIYVDRDCVATPQSS